MDPMRVVLVAALGVVFSVEPLAAQTPFRYREYALESSVASVLTSSGVREADVKDLHARPAKIQEFTWRAPYARSGTALADPVRDVVFSFCDDKLYQVLVTYDRDRTDGLTNDDLIESLSSTYGVPLLRQAKPAQPVRSADVPTDAVVVAQWEDSASSLVLTRGTYSNQYQLALISKTLQAHARGAIKEATRLDTQEAPQRDRDLRDKEASDARVASQKARVVNKAAFRP